MEYPFVVPSEFLIPPPDDHLTRSLYIKHVEIKGKEVRSFVYNKLNSCLFVDYLMKVEGSQAVDRLLSVAFKPVVNDRSRLQRGRQRLPFRHSYSRSSPLRAEPSVDESSLEIQHILRRGVYCSGTVFRFLGHSNSQLKDKTCYLFNATDEEIHDLLSRFADFSKTRGLAKRAKRIGLLFSSFNRSLSLREEEYAIISDIKERRFLLPETYSRYMFTDGCGLMSQTFAEEVQRAQNLRHTPSVIQIRYQGFKGILVLQPQLQNHKIHFRKSMEKFKVPDQDMRRSCDTLGVVEYSRPYSNGYLNTQITMLLADGGVSHDYLQQLQEEFYDVLKLFPSDRVRAERYLGWTGHIPTLNRLQRHGMTASVKDELKGLQSREIIKMTREGLGEAGEDSSSNNQRQSNKGKLRVLVPRSRIVFGVSDPYGYLAYGECFFQPTLPENEWAEFDQATEAVVTRNPCYHPGDIRVLKLVHSDRYAHLYDCIVFPVQGGRPHPDECSGGDLDGDKFFVSWDPQLVPPWRAVPFEYTSDPVLGIPSSIARSISGFVSEPKESLLSWGRHQLPRVFGTPEEEERKRKLRERDQLMAYFATNNNELVSRVDAIFMKFAKLFGPSCQECLELNQFFSDAVDMVADGMLVIVKLEELEKRHRMLTRNPQAIQDRPYNLLGNALFYFWQRKPAFRRGDDIWTRMEERSRIFVIDMKSGNAI